MQTLCCTMFYFDVPKFWFGVQNFLFTFWTKPLPQNRHLCSLVSVCIFSCLFNDPIVGNSLLQNLHGSPLNSEWVLTCAGKFLLRTFLLHTSHSTSYNIERQNCIVGILGIGISIQKIREMVNSRNYFVFYCTLRIPRPIYIERQNCIVGINSVENIFFVKFLKWWIRETKYFVFYWTLCILRPKK